MTSLCPGRDSFRFIMKFRQLTITQLACYVVHLTLLVIGIEVWRGSSENPIIKSVEELMIVTAERRVAESSGAKPVEGKNLPPKIRNRKLIWHSCSSQWHHKNGRKRKQKVFWGSLSRFDEDHQKLRASKVWSKGGYKGNSDVIRTFIFRAPTRPEVGQNEQNAATRGAIYLPRTQKWYDMIHKFVTRRWSILLSNLRHVYSCRPRLLKSVAFFNSWTARLRQLHFRL